MSEGTEGTRVTLRLPSDLHAAVVAFAKGDRSRPKASMNAALVFLLRAGLDQQSQQHPVAEPDGGNQNQG